MQAFTKAFSDTPLASRLYKKLAEGTGKNIDAGEPIPNIISHRVTWQNNAAIIWPRPETGLTEEAYDGAERLWLVGSSQPKACDSLFYKWRKAGRLSPELAWQRIALAMDKNQLKLARYLARFFAPHGAELGQALVPGASQAGNHSDPSKTEKAGRKSRENCIAWHQAAGQGKMPDGVLRAWQVLKERQYIQ